MKKNSQQQRQLLQKKLNLNQTAWVWSKKPYLSLASI